MDRRRQIELMGAISMLRDGNRSDIKEIKRIFSSVPEPYDAIAALMTYNTLGTALHSAAFRDFNEAVLCIVNILEPHKVVCQNHLFTLLRITNDCGNTVFHVAAFHSRLKIITSLLGLLTLENRYRVLLVQDTAGYTALHYAVNKGHEKVIKKILKELEPEQQKKLLLVTANNGQTVLDVNLHTNESTIACINTFKNLLEKRFQSEISPRSERRSGCNGGHEDSCEEEILKADVVQLQECKENQARQIQELERTAQKVPELQMAVLQLTAEIEQLRSAFEQLAARSMQTKTQLAGQAKGQVALKDRVDVMEDDVEYLLNVAGPYLEQPADNQ